MKSVNSRTQQFPASLEHLPQMLHFICEQAQHAGFHRSSLLKIELAAEEAIVNIITHGYEQISPMSYVTISCSLMEGGEFKISFTDTGKPFNPLEAIKRIHPKTLSSGDRIFDVGGYGIYFIVHMMDRVDYQRINDANVLTLTKNIF